MSEQKNVNRACYLLGILLFFSYIYPHHFHPFRAFFHDLIAFLAVVLSFGLLALTGSSPSAPTSLSTPVRSPLSQLFHYLQFPVALPLPVSLVLPVFVAAMIGLQTWNNMVLLPSDSIFPLLYLLGFAVAMILGAWLVQAEGGLDRLCLTLSVTFIAAGVISIVCQHIQLLGINGKPFVFPLTDRTLLRPFGNLGQPNLLASLLCFGLASLWWTSLTGRIGPRLAGALAVLFLWGLTLTQSRIGWVLMPIFVVFCWISFPTSKSLHKKVLLVLLGAYCVMVVCAPTLLNGVGVTVQGVGQRAGQVSIRLIYLQQAWFMTKLHPWFGAGWFEFGPQQVMFARLFNITEYSENAHNIVANLAVELGLPATILIIGASAYWFYRRCICYWSHPQLGSQVRFITLLFATLAVHSMVEYPLWYALMLLPFGVMIGALDFTSLQQEARAEAEIEAKTQAETNVQQVMPVRAKKMPTIVAIPRAWLVLCCLAALFVMVGVTWDYRRVMIGFTVLEQEQRGVYSTEFTTNRPAYTLFSQFYDYFYIARVKVYPGMPAQDIQFLEKMAIRFGFPPILERLAMAYAYNQRPSEALQVMATVERLHNPAYTGVYARWHSYADKDAGHFLAIFNRMPRPTSL